MVSRKIVERMLAGDSDRSIARELHVRRARVQQIRTLAEEYGYLNGSVALPAYPQALFEEEPDGRALRTWQAEETLNNFREQIEEQLGTGWYPITVFEELPVQVPRSCFYRYLHKHGLFALGKESRRVVPEIVHEPGEALILDWGKLCSVTVNGKRKSLWVFAGVLGYSRLIVAEVVWTNDTATTLGVLRRFLEKLGGVPRRLTTDNPKCFSLTADRYEPLLNPAYERFGSHYGVILECLPPREPEKKGKIERSVPYLRRLFQSFEPSGTEGVFEQAQAHLEKKLELANTRKHGTTGEKPLARFESTERAALSPLPAAAYELEEYSSATVRRDSHVRFCGKYYSVEPRFIGHEVDIIATAERVSIFAASKLIETHDRVTDPLHSKSTKKEHLAPWERQLQDDSYYRSKARSVGPNVAAFVDRILLPGNGFIDYRRICGVFSLEKSFSREAIDTACAQALSIDQISYRTVKKLLLAAASPVSVPINQTSPRFVRDISEYAARVNLRVINGGKP